MAITTAEGIEFSNQFCEAFNDGFIKNNHAETMKDFFAAEISLSWSDGTMGVLRTKEFMNIMRDGWGGMIDKLICCDPLVSVDTDQSRIVIASQNVSNVTGGLNNQSNLVLSNCSTILKLNSDKKITRWTGVWDPNNKQLIDAVAKVTKRLAKEMPKPKEPVMPITLEEGEAFAVAVLKAFSDGFAKNNFADTCANIFADKLSWNWSDGNKGEGSYNEVMKIVSKDWGSMVSSCLFSDPIVAVDTNRSVVAISVQHVMNVTGGFRDENNPVIDTVAYAMHLNEDKKCVKWNMCFDPNPADRKAAFEKVAKKLETVIKATKEVVASNTMAALATGQ
eukprot:79044_1